MINIAVSRVEYPANDTMPLVYYTHGKYDFLVSRQAEREHKMIYIILTYTFTWFL